MRKKDRTKYFLLSFVCIFIFIYGFIVININKPELVRKQSQFTMDLTIKPIDFRIETKEYVFYINNEIIDNVKEKYMSLYDKILSK